MAALVQTYPQQTSTVTMLQGRPSPSAGSFSPQHSAPRGPQGQSFSPSSSGSYRGLQSAGSVSPYAFTSTPQLSNNLTASQNYPAPHLRSQNRTFSAPTIFSRNQQPMPGQATRPTRQRLATSPPLMGSPSSSNSPQSAKNSLDDVSIGTRETSVDVPVRPKSTLGLSPSHLAQLTDSLASSKPSPDRYRRTNRSSPGDHSTGGGFNRLQAGAASPLSSGILPAGNLYVQNDSLARDMHDIQGEKSVQPSISSTDDLNLSRPQARTEMAQRYRRRSVGSFEAVGAMSNSSSPALSPPPPVGPAETRERRQRHDRDRPASSHAHRGSSDSVTSIRSTHSTGRNSTLVESGGVAGVAVAGPGHATSVSKQDVKLVNVAPRPDASSKRLTNPSPLSSPFTKPKSAAGAPEAQYPPTSDARRPTQAASESPAVQQLAAINKDSKKKSKLRRAFSFGSAAELQRVSAQNTVDRGGQPAKITKRNSKFEDEMDPEQAKIAQKQEAAGLGESIYSGQGHFFTGSTDNLSVQSSASSASVMLRKMGKGVKKSTRSVVGLFRPKSVVGVPAADAPVASTAQVTVVTVEAEREKVNINLNPHDQVGGGTGFPKLERNSIDASTSVDQGRAPTESSRRSMVGGQKERADVLAAVKKGILKRTDSSQSSPATTPGVGRTPDFNLPQIPHISDSPTSSEPSTPSDGAPPRSGHRRTDSLTIEGSDSDYFSSITQFASLGGIGGSLASPGSLSRNISFSPRIQFHDTWPSMEYDRRGDIATCNRLTPMLAQQIKEELNTFKMEMEVHESSKVYTHFF